MKKTITRTFLATLALLFCITFSSYAQTYYDLYLCDDATAKLSPTLAGQVLQNGDKVHWFRQGSTETTPQAVGTPITYVSTNPGLVDLQLPDDLPAGAYQYFSAIESAAGCLGPQSDAYDVYKLPTKTLALTVTNTTYCAESSGNQTPTRIDGSVITATTTPAETLPAGIEYAYEWSVTGTLLDGTPSTTAPGSAAASSAATNDYTMTTTTAGTYVFSAKVKYVKSSNNPGDFLSPGNNGCEVPQTATQQVVVTPKPVKPGIRLVTN